MKLSAHEKALVERLRELPAAARAAALDDACAGNPALQARRTFIAGALAENVSAHPAPLPPSTEGAARLLGFALDSIPASDETSGMRVGSYKLLQKIGEGGFGVVWMAEQLEPIRRHVAVKILKLGMDTEEVIARFEAERQALALMEHPNIARVFDAGATELGRPYFVMELVRGIPITRYCDNHRLAADTRLRLFIAVCRAVQHAHQKGVIHRDLKPSNILVTLHDGQPVPKIIDFGIAKATSSRLTEKTLFTQFHAFIGTPAYTSPEQMEMSGLDVDTRSDIYSLGVLLYELLTGRPPFDAQTLAHAGLDEMRRLIREVDPPRPSTRLDTLSSADRTSLAQQRGTEAGKLSLLLRGDLDWIVMHALEKDRTRRYDSATALADDVLRYLQDEPVLARPPSAGYRLGKYLRRHKLAVGAGVAVGVSLVVALVLTSVLLVREQAARDREAALRAEAEARANEARIAAAKSAQVAQFMKDMLGGVAPSVARSRDTTLLREVLDATAQKLDVELSNQPEVAADLRDTLGAVYRDLGLFPVAEKLFREAVATRRSLPAGEGAELAASLENYARLLGQLGKPEGEKLMREALAIRRKFFGDKHPLVATTLFHLSGLLTKLDEREALRRQVLALRLEIFGPEHPEVADSLFSLGAVAYQRNDLAESARLFRETLAMRRKLLGNDHPVLVDSLISLGWTLSEDEQWPEAEAAFREGLRLAIQVVPEHPAVTSALLRLAGGQPRVVRDDTLVALARETVAAQGRRLGPQAPTVSVSSLALALLLSGRPETAAESEALTREAGAALATSRQNGARLDPQTMQDLTFCTSRRIFFAAAPEQAFAPAEQALLLTRATFGPNHVATASPLSLLALANFYTGRTAEARALEEEAVPLFQKGTGADRIPALPHLAMLGAANRETGRLAEAERVLRDGLALMRQSGGATGGPDPSVAAVYCELGLTLNAQSRFTEAEQILRQSLANHDRVEREKATQPRTRMWLRLRPRAEAESGLGQALAGQSRFDEAEPLLRQAFAALEAQRDTLAGDRTKLLREAAGRLGDCYLAWHKADQAAEWTAKRVALADQPQLP